MDSIGLVWAEEAFMSQAALELSGMMSNQNARLHRWIVVVLSQLKVS